jgi:Short C-terminal domain
MFGKKGLEAGEATIVESHVKHHSGGQGQGNLREWVADVRPVNGEPFRAVIQLPNLALDFREPMKGDVVRVLIDPKNAGVKFDKSDPRLSLKVERAREQERFKEAAAGHPGSAAVSATANHGVAPTAITNFEGMRVVNAADAASMLQALVPGDPQARDRAVSELREHAATPGVAERLSALQSLKDAGTLTDEEYDAQRQRIIGSI